MLPSYRARKRLAACYLKGSGLEIGALHQPLIVPPDVTVSFVDYATREENIQRFPEIDAHKVVTTHLIDDGFNLSSVATASQDFIIANHVLEHASNPIQVLMNWERLLKEGGVIFLSVPIGARCFERGRAVTTVEYFVADYEAVRSNDNCTSERMNREHYSEWLTISLPRINKNNNISAVPLTATEIAEQTRRMVAEEAEIHFHVFSRKSLADFLIQVTRRYLPTLRLLLMQRSKCGAEYIAILKK